MDKEDRRIDYLLKGLAVGFLMGVTITLVEIRKELTQMNLLIDQSLSAGIKLRRGIDVTNYAPDKFYKIPTY
jgi:hypothetical protein